VAAGFGNALLAAAVFRPDAPYTAYRISLRVQDPPASGTPETEGFRRLTVRLGPNPSTGEVTFWLDLPGTGSVEADVFHSDGRLVRRFAQDREAGRHSWIWDGRDSRGRWVTPGVYLVRVRANAEERVFKLVRRAR